MNKERILELADVIENSKVPNLQFRMADWKATYGCGTVGCIAGWTVAHFEPERFATIYSFEVKDAALKILDLWEDDDECVDGNEIFMPHRAANESFSYFHITKEMAARVLRAYANTRVVIWDDVFKEAEEK